MEVKFSRHAKRRANLYAIPESRIVEILEGTSLAQGTQAILANVEGFAYPLKIVVAREDDIITVISSYPLKRGGKK
ncbi:MAG: hypothetical protein HYX92_18440 [Chloroflexi bacterium]|nr:hypothetical protein [Chloroflexota bacterium]